MDDETGIAMVRWTRAVGVFTALLFVVGALQLWDLYETNSFNRKAMVAIQSPFVFVKATIFLPVKTPNNEIYWRIMPIWENSGNTAPSDLSVDIYCQTSGNVASNPWAFRDTGKISTGARTLGPKQETGGGYCQYSAADIIRIQHGELHLYVTAMAHYRDHFDMRYMHVTEYCAELVDITGDPNVPPKLVSLNNSCATHNCTDEECKT